MTDEFQDAHGSQAPGDLGKDLFGEPPSAYRDPRGRKKLRVTNDLRDRIAVLRAAGMDREEIADAIGCSERTLRTYFLPELNEGKSVKRAEAIARLFELGISGNVSALKAFIGLTEKSGTLPQALAPKAVKLGKKEQLVRDAVTGHQDSDWGALLEGKVAH